MSLSLLLLALSSLASASPQYGGPVGNTPTSSSSAAVPTASLPGQHIIQVAPGQQFIFQPNTVQAKENETVTFVFPGSIQHSVTQSTFDAPCNLMGEAGNTTVGFDSGLSDAGQFTLTVSNASQPIWFFCKQFGPPSHCGSGMVGAINPPSSGNTFDAFQSNAEKLGSSFPQDTHTGALTGVGAFATSATTAGSSAGVSLVAAPSAAFAAVAVLFSFFL